MAERPTNWPSAISTLLPQHLIHLATSYPEVVYAEVPRTPDTFDYMAITYRQLNNAVNSLAWWIKRTIGHPSNAKEIPTMVYMGPNDLRHIIIFIGAAKAGYKVLFPTPRYSAEGLSILIQKVESKIMLVPSAPFPVVHSILEKTQMDLYQIPELIDLISQEPQEYPYTKTFKQAKTEPLVVLHTSGTTGFPKPVVWTNDWVDSFAQGNALQPPQGFESMLERQFYKRGTRMLILLSPFHASGFQFSGIIPLHQGTTIILPPYGLPPSASLAAQVLDHVPNVDIIATPPPYVEELGSNPELLDRISQKAKSIVWGGGDISTGAGEAISAKMELFTDIGSTEMGLCPILKKVGPWNSDDWHWMHFHPELKVQFEHVNEDIYEAFIIRNLECIQPVFKVFSDIKDFPMGDLFQKHPKREGLWKHYGRADDLIAVITGEKFHPTETEQRISSHPAIAEALLVGTRRPRASLILRLEDGGREVSDDIWNFIEGINKDLYVYVKVGRDMIVVVQDEFLKTAKGSVRRKEMGELYEKELDKLYNR